jgi:enamine deaminase RidA (YjgF/YER057c/UK114 family)
MTHTITNPATLHDPTGFGYSHVAEAGGGLVFVAGQYASDEAGQVTAADFAAQVEASLANLGVALRAEGPDYGHAVPRRPPSGDHDADKRGSVAAAVARIWGGRPPTQTLAGVAALALPEMRFEVDAIAVRP